jgi:hypothetical protein
MLPPQMSSLAATSTIPVTNAAKQENTRRSCRILIMAASPAPTRPPDLAEWAKSRLYKIAHPAIFGPVMHGSRGGFRVGTLEGLAGTPLED